MTRITTFNRRPRVPFSQLYSPKLVETEFSEGLLHVAERSSVRRVMSSSCSHPSSTKE